MNNVASIRPILTPADFQALQSAAAEDNHGALYPTHSVFKNGEIVGSLGILSMPVLTWWLHSKKTNVRDSTLVRAVAETIIAGTQHRDYIMPCQMDSPYYPHMNRLGYEFIGNCALFKKGL